MALDGVRDPEGAGQVQTLPLFDPKAIKGKGPSEHSLYMAYGDLLAGGSSARGIGGVYYLDQALADAIRHYEEEDFSAAVAASDTVLREERDPQRRARATFIMAGSLLRLGFIAQAAALSLHSHNVVQVLEILAHDPTAAPWLGLRLYKAFPGAGRYESSQLTFLVGRGAFYNGDYERAVNYLGAIGSTFPQNGEVHFLLGQSFLRLGRESEAEAAFQKGIQLGGEEGGETVAWVRKSYLALAVLINQDERFPLEGARSGQPVFPTLDLLHKIPPRPDKGWWDSLCDLFGGEDEPTDPLQGATYPEWRQALMEKGLLYLRAGDAERALGSAVALQKAAGDTEYYPEVYWVRARVYEQAGKKAQALAAINAFKGRYLPVIETLHAILAEGRGGEDELFTLVNGSLEENDLLRKYRPRFPQELRDLLARDPSFKAYRAELRQLEKEARGVWSHETWSVDLKGDLLAGIDRRRRLVEGQAGRWVKGRLADILNNPERGLGRIFGELVAMEDRLLGRGTEGQTGGGFEEFRRDLREVGKLWRDFLTSRGIYEARRRYDPSRPDPAEQLVPKYEPQYNAYRLAVSD